MALALRFAETLHVSLVENLVLLPIPNLRQTLDAFKRRASIHPRQLSPFPLLEFVEFEVFRLSAKLPLHEVFDILFVALHTGAAATRQHRGPPRVLLLVLCVLFLRISKISSYRSIDMLLRLDALAGAGGARQQHCSRSPPPSLMVKLACANSMIFCECNG